VSDNFEICVTLSREQLERLYLRISAGIVTGEFRNSDPIYALLSSMFQAASRAGYVPGKEKEDKN